ncbi:MAG TPA: lytic transglycosylase domain-containing protein [Actinoplanes sp.]|nr:lytic transglycosylase domain-containing protein [Actinoplanes sp.]
MNRLRTTGARVASVVLLLAGLVGGVYVAQHQNAKQAAAESAAATEKLLVAREVQHAADRAAREEAVADAAVKAESVAKTAAAGARSLEKAQAKAVAAAKAEAKRKAEEAAGPVPFNGPIPSSCNEFSGSRKTGCALMLAAGFGIAEFPCLNKLWDHESGWNYKAENRSSGAYGIPQSLPGSKMASAGADWKTNPATQIKWGLGYIKGRYDTPCGAWNFFQDRGHY